jgi:hypothetical protein
VEREETSDGTVVFYEDFYFRDPDGDATAVVYTLISTDPALGPGMSITTPDDTITASPDEQKHEGLVPTTFAYKPVSYPITIAIQARIRDRAGNLGEPVIFRAILGHMLLRLRN